LFNNRGDIRQFVDLAKSCIAYAAVMLRRADGAVVIRLRRESLVPRGVQSGSVSP
jgi:hypothetical protein